MSQVHDAETDDQIRNLQEYIPILLELELPENITFEPDSSEEDGTLYIKINADCDCFYTLYRIFYFYGEISIRSQNVHYIDIDGKALDEYFYEEMKRASLNDLLIIDEIISNI